MVPVYAAAICLIFLKRALPGIPGAGRKKATGMGLYLAKEIADDLKLLLEADSRWGKGFVMTIKFPVIN